MSNSEVLGRFSIKAVAHLSMWDASKVSFKTILTLFLRKSLDKFMIEIDFNK